MKKIELPRQIKKLPKHLKIILSGFGLAIIGVLMYYLATASPMFGRAELPTVFVNGASNVTKTTVDLGGIVSNDSDEEISVQGIQYGPDTNYGSTLSQPSNGSSSYSLEATGLTCNTTYHYRAYVTLPGSTSSYVSSASKVWGGARNIVSNSIVTNDAGEQFTTGYFAGSINFNPDGSDVQTSPSNSIYNTFLTKRNVDGSYAWTKVFGGSATYIEGRSIGTASDGSVFVVGQFRGTATFNPSGADSQTAAGGTNWLSTYVTKFNADGTYAWTKKQGSATTDVSPPSVGNSTGVDSNGNVYLGGTFGGTTNFNADGSDTRTATGSERWGFITKLNADGTYGWTKALNASSSVSGVVVDSANRIRAIGFVSAAGVNFNPNGADVQSGPTSFVSSWNPNGTYGSTKIFGGAATLIRSITLDDDDNIYTAGYFSGTANFNPDGSDELTNSSGSQATYISKWGADTSYEWTRKLTNGSGGFSAPYGLTTDATGNVYAGGIFYGTVNFNPTAVGSADNQTAPAQGSGTPNGYVVRLNPSGGYGWSKKLASGSGVLLPSAMAVDTTDRLFIASIFSGILDFSLGGTTDTRNSTSGKTAIMALDIEDTNVYSGDDAFTTATCDVTPEVASVTTDPASSLTATTASLNGIVTEDGSAEITERGFRYGTTDSYGQTASESVSSSITFDSQWGSAGTGNSQFNTAQFMATDSQGNVYITDNGNDRVQKFTPTGTYITQWGTTGTSIGQFGGPSGIAVDSDDNIYVADTNNHRIQKFTSTGTYITQWGSSGTGNSQFSYMTGLAVDASNNVYSADTGNNRIQKFTSTGTYITKWGSTGSGNGQFNVPLNIAIDSIGNVYVTEGTNHRIQKFTSTGTYITKWGTNGTGNGQFQNPWGIVIDNNDNIYVSDVFNQRLQRFQTDGTFVEAIGMTGQGGAFAERPWGLAIDPTTGDLFVSDLQNTRIQKYDIQNNLGAFSLPISGLTCGTTYHYQAYAINPVGTGYGDDRTFETSACPAVPDVTTDPVTLVTTTTATMNGTLNGIGGSAVTARGFQYGSTTSYGSTTNLGAGTAGAFSSNLTGLTCGTVYHYRAYATNTTGTATGTDETITTLGCPGAPLVTTENATSVAKTSADLNGTITDDGGSALLTRGFQYGSTNGYGQTVSASTSSTGSFSDSLSSLSCGTTYYFRAFATNSQGPGYGQEETFATNACDLPPAIVITAPTNNQRFGSTTTSVDLVSSATSITSQIDRVEYFVDGVFVGSVLTPPYKLTALGLPVGVHVLDAKTYDVLGASASATPVTFYVQAPSTTPPTVTPPTTTPTTPTTTSTTEEPAIKQTKDVKIAKKDSYTRASVAPPDGLLDIIFGHKIFKAVPFSLILLLLIMAALYARQAIIQYNLRSKIIATTKRYQATLQASNEYLAITAHYLNTPLAIMNGAVEMIANAKLVADSATDNLLKKLKSFALGVEQTNVNNQASAAKSHQENPELNPKIQSPFKDKAVWIPSIVVIICLAVANMLFVGVGVLTNSWARVIIEFGLCILACGILALSRRYLEISKAAKIQSQQQLSVQAKLYEQRREFVDTTRVLLETHYGELETAGQRIKQVPQSKLFFNGLAMIASLAKGLETIHKATDMSAKAPLFAVSPFVHRLIQDFQTKADQQQVTLIADITSQPSVHIQPDQINQLVGSLLDNAIVYNKPGGQVKVSVKKRFSKVQITVADDGIGIPSDRLAELFQPFARATDAMRYDYQGKGLNLYINKVIMARIGGDLKMTSELNKGTTVSITLPSASNAETLVAPDVITPNATNLAVVSPTT